MVLTLPYWQGVMFKKIIMDEKMRIGGVRKKLPIRKTHHTSYVTNFSFKDLRLKK